jgi:replicative DNA helicase
MSTNPRDILDRMPPSSPEAEAAVLGSLILDYRAVDHLDNLHAEHFHDRTNAVLFRAILDLHQAGRPGDTLALVEHLRAAGTYERIGGASRIAQLAASVPNAAHVRHYAGIVREKAARRALIDAAAIVLQQAHDERRPLADQLATLEQTLADLAGAATAPNNIADGPTLAQVAIDELERRKAGTSYSIPTGFPPLDRLLGGGFEPGELVVLGARTSAGKTALALNVISHAIRAHRPVLIFSIEMLRHEIAKRLVASAARVSSLKLDHGALTSAEEAAYLDEARRLHASPILLDDSPSQTITSLTSTARRLTRKHRVDLIVADYLQLIEPPAKGHSREREIAEIARRLKSLAQELRVPVFCLAQLNREGAGDRPKLHHLRESDAIAHEANRVLLLHRPGAETALDPRQGENVEIIVSKNRSGPTGTVSLLWFRDCMRFETPAAPHQAEPERFSVFDEWNERNAAETR